MVCFQMHAAKPTSAKPTIEILSDKNHCAACQDALAAAAHELKTPLAIMGGYLNLLLTQKLGPLTAQQLEVLSEMQDNGVRLTNFVQNVLSYATLESGALPVSVRGCRHQCLPARNCRVLGATIPE